MRSTGTLITTFGDNSSTDVLAAVKKINGVSSVRVNPVKRSVHVEYDPTVVSASVIKAACRASPIPFLNGL
jgi:copper chaperone CopZ